ncbi:hypothetical protein BDN72DRAFT_903712 [Pluteus cervinus]|uniref:Uncharacterized protein n=1 Tax=Pluteus cervinus TaxID=181527 RepID=A0ACD3A900_9AGAR|nr:hypothetical protein BDN72DRAFT_903712 [Pluteus cervinus]
MSDQPMNFSLNATVEGIPPEGMVLEFRFRPTVDVDSTPVAVAGSVNPSTTSPTTIVQSPVILNPTTPAPAGLVTLTSFPARSHFTSWRPVTSVQREAAPPPYARHPGSTIRPTSSVRSNFTSLRPLTVMQRETEPPPYTPRPSTTRPASPSSEISTEVRGVGRRSRGLLQGGAVQHRGTFASRGSTFVQPRVRQPVQPANPPIFIHGSDSESEEVGLPATSTTAMTPSLTTMLGESEEDLWKQVPDIPEVEMTEAAEVAEAIFLVEAMLAIEAMEAADALLAEAMEALLAEATAALTLTSESRGDGSSSESTPPNQAEAPAATNLSCTVETLGNDEVRTSPGYRARSAEYFDRKKRNLL